MSTDYSTQVCPRCQVQLPVAVKRCDSCGTTIASAGGRLEAVDLLVPRKVSGWSIASCYFGLIGLLLPLFGFFFAFPAVVFGIVALLRKRGATSYGSVTSDLRAAIGLILGGLGSIVWGYVWLLVLSRPGRW